MAANKQTDRHTHARAQGSHASVGLAQARPNQYGQQPISFSCMCQHSHWPISLCCVCQHCQWHVSLWCMQRWQYYTFITVRIPFTLVFSSWPPICCYRGDWSKGVTFHNFHHPIKPVTYLIVYCFVHACLVMKLFPVTHFIFTVLWRNECATVTSRFVLEDCYCKWILQQL